MNNKFNLIFEKALREACNEMSLRISPDVIFQKHL